MMRKIKNKKNNKTIKKKKRGARQGCNRLGSRAAWLPGMLSPLPFVVSGPPDTRGLWRTSSLGGRRYQPALRSKLLLFLPSCCLPLPQLPDRRWESSPDFCPGSRKVAISQTRCKCGKGERTGKKQDALFLPSSSQWTQTSLLCPFGISDSASVPRAFPLPDISL